MNKTNTIMLTYHSTPGDCVRRYTAVGIVKYGILRVGLAITSPKDQFSRKLGRLIAIGRAERAPFVHVSLPDEELETIHNLFHKVASKDACTFIHGQLNIKPSAKATQRGKGVDIAKFYGIEQMLK